MTSSIKEESVCSPDSTVSSLLTSCSIDSSNPYSDSLIRYKDKLYSSASEALEAYIEDFDLSLTSSEISTGKICIYQSTPKKCSKRHAKEKHALDDFNQQVGLGSLGSPSRRQTECDSDLISLATDDLLAFPADGSLPFVQQSPSKSKHQSSERKRQSLKTSFCPCQTSSLNTEISFSLRKNGKVVAHQNPHKDSSKKKCSVYTPDGYDSASSKGSSRPLSFEEISNTFKNYPRWLTSQKSDLSVSGISSIPNFHYPVWIKSHNLLSDSAKERDGQNFNTQSKASSSQTSDILKKGHSVDKDSSNFLEQNDCLDLRGNKKVEESCNCDSTDACFPFDNSFSRHTKKPLTEDQLELLTLKADRGLKSSTEDLSNTPENDDSPSTTDILGGERSWENALGAFKPPVPVCCEDVEGALPFPKADIIHKFLEDCLNDKNKENTFSGGHHHRPLEALKLMLFKLQTVQGSLSLSETAEQKEEFKKLSEKADSGLKLWDSEIIPLTNSLQKALHHLSRLKISLAEDNSNHQEQTNDHEEDKQEKITCEADINNLSA